MLCVEIISVGKVKQVSLQNLCQEYVKRLSGFCKLSFIETPKTKCVGSCEMEVLKLEGAHLLKRIDSDSFKIAMCVEGSAMTSVEFANKIKNVQNLGFSKLSFIIGGAYGLSDEVKKRADLKLSLSAMTLPHKLARLVLIEQIYRAYTILNGNSYHK